VIALHRRQVRRKLGLYRGALSQHFAAGQGQDVANGFVEVEPILAGWRLLGQGADSVDDVTGPPAICDDTAEGLEGLVQIGRISSQPARGGLGVGDRGGNRLVGP
jgi:hypothetical protein